MISGIERDKLSPSYGKQVLFRIHFSGDQSGDMIMLWKKPIVISPNLQNLANESAKTLKEASGNLSGAITVGDTVECISDKTVDGKRFVYVICKDYIKAQEGYIWENQLTNYGKEPESEKGTK